MNETPLLFYVYLGSVIAGCIGLIMRLLALRIGSAVLHTIGTYLMYPLYLCLALMGVLLVLAIVLLHIVPAIRGRPRG